MHAEIGNENESNSNIDGLKEKTCIQSRVHKNPSAVVIHVAIERSQKIHFCKEPQNSRNTSRFIESRTKRRTNIL